MYAGGSFHTAEWHAVSAPYIARWDGAWSSLAGGTGGNVHALTVFDDGSGPALYAGGEFKTAGGVTASGVARWQATVGWSPLQIGTNEDGLTSAVQTLAVFDDGTGEALYAAGAFTTAGSIHANHIASWDGTTWSRLGLGTNDEVWSLAVFDDGSGASLYAGGDFITAGGVSVNAIARWDGSFWSALGSGVDSTVRSLAVFDDGSGPALYAGGQFHTAGGVGADSIAKWDGANWSPLGHGVYGSVDELIVFDDGTGAALYAGGYFIQAGGASANNIAKWNGTAWSALGNGTNDGVAALAVFDDGSGPALYVGGFFTSAGDVPANYVARWNGNAWSALGAEVNGPVTALNVFDLGTGPALYAGGFFRRAGALEANGIARWDGTSWAVLGSGIGGTFPPQNGTYNRPVFALAEFDDGQDGDADLYAAGDFVVAGDRPSANIAQWHGCTPVPVQYCFGDGTTATSCPCSNFGAAGRGCDNSAATTGAELAAAGTIQPDTIVLTSAGELSSALSFFFQGDASLSAGTVFGDGVRCVAGNLLRLYVETAIGGTAIAPTGSDPSITAQSANLGDPIASGDTRYYQVYYRDSDLTFCPNPPGNSWNVSNAVRIPW